MKTGRSRASSVQGREGAKDDGRSSEAGGVEVGAQESIDASQTGGRSGHGVIGRGETVPVLIPYVEGPRSESKS